MNALARRVQRLEAQRVDTRNEKGQTMAEVVRERRRRRLAAAGRAFGDRRVEAPALGRSLAGTIRLGRCHLLSA